ncbi:MAG: FG-GAP repeat domain-containing protein [Planctomycetota bacterium]|jgi:hypothetical protein
MSRDGVLLTSLATLALSQVGLAQFVLDPAVNYAAGSQPSGVAAADFDGDGDRDVATTVDGPDRIAVLLNDGSGVFAAGPASNLPNSSSPQDLVAADVDGDGDMDLAVAVRDPVGSVVMMLNTGAGTFTVGTSVTVQDRPRGLSTADIDNDGDMDFAVANRDSNSATVIINQGGGSFTTQTVSIGGESRDTTLLDIDGDGDGDLAVTDHDNRAVDTFVNDGAATFTAGPSLSVGPLVRPDGVTSADLDGNGDMDIAVAVSDQTLNINQAMVFTNFGGVFSGPFAYDTGGDNTSDIATGDFDCDGQLDIVTSNQASNDTSFLRNIGAAVFGAAQIVATQLSPEELAASDLDGDGDADVAVANRDSDSISIVLNQTCSPCPWDLDGSGSVGTSDLLDLLAQWGTNPGGPPDFDGDGNVGTSDLLALLGNWGPCL